VSIPQKPEEGPAPIEAAIDFLRVRIAPFAQEIDTESEALGRALKALADAGLLGLRVPPEHGGAGCKERDFRRFQEECARASGCLAFLQTQHQSACAMLAKSANEKLKRELLPPMASGIQLSGIAFSQLRRKAASPALAAEPVDGGYRLSGSAPWVTGLGFFENCVTAATLPDGDTLFVVHPLRDDGIELTPPMRLASMEPANTVSATFSNYFVPVERKLYKMPGNWIDNNDMINIALQSPFALGCARAALDIVQDNFARKGIPGIRRTLERLSDEVRACRDEAYAAMDDRENTDRSLRARARAIELALKCSAAAVVSSSGAGNAASHPAQRVYREALVFSVSAQTVDIMEATLQRLSGYE
jgi:alkylation response protein AidB-like acyl-CoA dehydrogenase